MNSGPSSISRVRVRYPEVDRMGFVHHARYFEWLEIGRTELLRAAGTSYRELEERENIRFPVAEASMSYRQPAGYDDLVEVETTLTELGRCRLRFVYSLTRAGDQTPLAEGFTVHACIDPDGRLKRIPRPLRQALTAVVSGAP